MHLKPSLSIPWQGHKGGARSGTWDPLLKSWKAPAVFQAGSGSGNAAGRQKNKRRSEPLPPRLVQEEKGNVRKSVDSPVFVCVSDHVSSRGEVWGRGEEEGENVFPNAASEGHRRRNNTRRGPVRGEHLSRGVVEPSCWTRLDRVAAALGGQWTGTSWDLTPHQENLN